MGRRADLLPVAPVVRHRETFLDPEYLLQAGGEVGDGLHVVVGRIDHGAKMVEVDVGHQEFPAGSQYPGDLLELLGLMAAHVLEDAQRNDDVESLGAKRDVVLDEVSLNQIGSGLLDGDVQTVVVDVGSEQSPQARRSASDVEQITVSALGLPVQEAGAFAQTKVWLRVLKIFTKPEIPVHEAVVDGAHVFSHDRSLTSQVATDRRGPSRSPAAGD